MGVPLSLFAALLACEGAAPPWTAAPPEGAVACDHGPIATYAAEALCQGVDDDGDGLVDEGCSSCDLLVTRARSWWLTHDCVVRGDAMDVPLLPVHVGSTTLSSSASVRSFLARPYGGDLNVVLGQLLVVGRLNAAAFNIGRLPWVDWDADGALDTVDDVLAVADGWYDAGGTPRVVDMVRTLASLADAGAALPAWFDEACATPPETCEGTDEDADGAVDEACACHALAGGWDLDVDGVSYSLHDGQDLSLAVVDDADGAVLAAATAVVSGGRWAFSFPGLLAAGVGVDLHVWADFDADGTCDMAPIDHSWVHPQGVPTGHRSVRLVHTGLFDDAACASF